MRLLIVPPHADFTLGWRAEEGFEVLDLARAFVERIGRPEGLRAEASRAVGEGEAGARRALLLHSAAGLLERSTEARTRLRALGAALSGSSAPDLSVRLRLDDLELAQGTTERSADTLAASVGSLPFEPELAAALQACEGAEVLRLWLERDQQLPAALALAARAPRGLALELCGPFAQVHRQTLSRLAPFERARWVDAAPRPGLLGLPGSRLDPALGWGEHTDAAGWCGAVSLSSLAAPEALLGAGCRGALVRFCAVGPVHAQAEDGQRLPVETLQSACAALREAGVPVVGEWWVGAPGQSEAERSQTAAWLEGAAPFSALAGVRQFHWARERAPASWRGGPVRWLPFPEDRDLQRSRPFEAEGGLPHAELPARIEALALRLSQRFRLAPGRLAQAIFSTEASPSRQAHPALDPDCAVVELPVALSGATGPAFYAVNLRKGGTVQLDARIAPPLLALAGRRAVEGNPFERWPAAQREKLVAALTAKGVLAEVN